MMSLLPRCLALFATLVLSPLLAAQDVSPTGPHVSPFRGMRAVDEVLEVQIADDTWFALQSIAGVDTTTLLQEAVRLCGDNAWKRVTEDLPALLDAMGHQVGERVDLQVRDLATGAVTDLPQVLMTRANRNRLRGTPRPARWPLGAGATIPAASALSDLEELRRLLDEQFAYRELRPVDLEALLHDAATALGPGPVDLAAFTRQVDHILRAFGDGHSRVDGVAPTSDCYLPFLIQGVVGGHVAFAPTHSGFLASLYPFVTAIDGVPLDRWLEAARQRGTQGSAVMQARDSERGLRDLGELRAVLQLPPSDTVHVTLRGAVGSREVTLATTTRRPIYGAWPHSKTRRLDGDVGYLRIEQMRGDPEFLDGLDAAMQSFRDTRGLVLDVRGNGGGTRDALRRLAPYLLGKDASPVVGNVAAMLVDRRRPLAPEALADRGLYLADWPGWSDAQRRAITAFARGFQPSWKLPPGKFSAWHFLVLDRGDNPKAFDYDKKVIVLIDRGCFSATDVFAAALGALPNVTLVGETTSGGSGRAQSFVLPKTGVRLQLSSMASFRPDGVLFEGHGVVPEIEVAMQPGDPTGATDTALQRACELLR